MATWVAVIVRTAGREDFWDVTRSLGVTAEGLVAPYVLIDCGSRFAAVRELGRELSQAVDTETIAFAAQTATDVHVIWVHQGGELVRELEYVRDDGGWRIWSGTVQHGSRRTSSAATSPSSMATTTLRVTAARSKPATPSRCAA